MEGEEESQQGEPRNRPLRKRLASLRPGPPLPWFEGRCRRVGSLVTTKIVSLLRRLVHPSSVTLRIWKSRRSSIAHEANDSVGATRCFQPIRKIGRLMPNQLGSRSPRIFDTRSRLAALSRISRVFSPTRLRGRGGPSEGCRQYIPWHRLASKWPVTNARPPRRSTHLGGDGEEVLSGRLPDVSGLVFPSFL
jgi:hypothetical protein